MLRVGILLLTLMPMFTTAQGVPTEVTRVLSYIEVREPAWKLEKKDRAGDYHLFKWKSGKSSVSVLMRVCESGGESAGCLEALTYDLTRTAGLRMRKTDVGVEGLGDESFMWEDESHHGEVGVSFGKGKYVAFVIGSSAEVARRFARHIAEQLPAA